MSKTTENLTQINDLYSTVKDIQSAVDSPDQSMPKTIDKQIAIASLSSNALNIFINKYGANSPNAKAAAIGLKFQIDGLIIASSLVQSLSNIKNGNYSGAYSNVLSATSVAVGMAAVLTNSKSLTGYGTLLAAGANVVEASPTIGANLGNAIYDIQQNGLVITPELLAGFAGKSLSEIPEVFHNILPDQLQRLIDDLLKGIIDALNDISKNSLLITPEILKELNGDIIQDWAGDFFEWQSDAWNPWKELDRNGVQKYHFIRYDPIVLDLDGDGIETTAQKQFSGTLFDHDNDGIRTATGWVKADDGILVIDRNNDGKINDGGELFGDSVTLKDGSIAKNGYEALAEFDSNLDGKVNALDENFAQLKIWRDLNQDGISDTNELFGLEELGVKSLNLAYQNTTNQFRQWQLTSTNRQL